MPGASGERQEQDLRDDPRLSQTIPVRAGMISPRCNYRLHLLSRSSSRPKSRPGAFPHLGAADSSDRSFWKDFFPGKSSLFPCWGCSGASSPREGAGAQQPQLREHQGVPQKLG